MIRQVLEDIAGIARFPLISLVLFVLVFSGMLIAVLRMRRKHLDHMRQLPLEDD